MTNTHETRTHHYINGQSTTLEKLPTKVQLLPWADIPRSLVGNCHFSAFVPALIGTTIGGPPLLVGISVVELHAKSETFAFQCGVIPMTQTLSLLPLSRSTTF